MKCKKLEPRGKGEGMAVFEHLVHPRAHIRLVTNPFSFIIRTAILWTKYNDPHFMRGDATV